MPDDSYIVDILVTGTATVFRVDQEGIDRIEIQGSYIPYSEINLAWSSSDGVATAASGIYFFPDNEGHRLIVSGPIEDARGGIGNDSISGNEMANKIWGDQTVFDIGLSDTLSGAAGNDTIYGGTGNDVIGGDGDHDLLYGDAGADLINGGGGDDTIHSGLDADEIYGGGDAGDLLSYAMSDVGVKVLITHGSQTLCFGGHAEGDKVSGFRKVYGSDFNDEIYDTVENEIAFSYNANTFSGDAGNDLLSMGGGRDSAAGGSGRDTIFGGNQGDELYGNGQNDTIFGDDGNDKVYGDGGNDSLYDGKGDDFLSGGAGADKFVFENRGPAQRRLADIDYVEDFTASDGDRIILTFIDASELQEGDQRFRFLGETDFDGRVRALVVDTSDPSSIALRADINGDRRADVIITLANVETITADMIAL